MVGNGGAATLDEFIELTQRAVSCLAPAVVIQRRRAPDAPPFLTLSERFAALSEPHGLSFSLLHAYLLRPANGRRANDVVHSVGYSYQIHRFDGEEVVAFHWHPGRTKQVQFPHLHLESRSDRPAISRGHHIPSGRVSIEAVVRFAIEELGVRPLRPDWLQLIEIGIETFDAARSW